MEPLSITELRKRARFLRVEGYTLEFWPNGTWFLEAPSGEGTELPEAAIGGAFAKLFKKFF